MRESTTETQRHGAQRTAQIISSTAYHRSVILALITRLPGHIATDSCANSGHVITDPAQIISKQKFDIQPFTIEKLYMTHNIGDSSWSPDDKQVAFVTNISGRNNIWLVSAQSGWPTQLTVSNQRQANVCMVTQGPLDRLQL